MTDAGRQPTLLVVGTLDTKGDECRYFADCARESGVRVLLMDTGIFGDDDDAEIDRYSVAVAAGSSVESVREKGDRATAVRTMGRGARVVTAQLARAGEIDAVAGLGGSGGTAIASDAIRDLPIGMPKLLLSTTVSGDTRPYVHGKDVTMMYSVVDIAGLNRLSRTVLANAASAAAGMARRRHQMGQLPAEGASPLIGATMWGNTTPCVTAVRGTLEAHGFEVLTFHATGEGGQSMEDLMRDSFISGVVDITTTEIVAEVLDSPWSARPGRLEVAGELGLPQVVVPGAVDMVGFGPLDQLPDRLRGRLYYEHNSAVTLVRTLPDEAAEAASRIASKLAPANGPVAVVIPLRGFSRLGEAGGPFHDAATDAVFIDVLKAQLPNHVELLEIDATINDPVFSAAVGDRFLSLWAAWEKASDSSQLEGRQSSEATRTAQSDTKDMEDTDGRTERGNPRLAPAKP